MNHFHGLISNAISQMKWFWSALLLICCVNWSGVVQAGLSLNIKSLTFGSPVTVGDSATLSVGVFASGDDFYSLSEFKDLLFHVQESRFSIPQISSCLKELGLKFCGFESNNIVKNFKLINSGTNDAYNLDKWAQYEEAYPQAFRAMFQFWCQKVAKS